jgi:hypothetical protein
MAKRTNRVAWSLVVVLGIVVAWGGMALAGYSQRDLPEHWRSGVILLPRSQWGFGHSRVYWIHGPTEPATDRFVIGFLAVRITHHGLDAPLVVTGSRTRR